VNDIREIAVRRLFPEGNSENASRPIPVEAAIAIEVNGIGYAVMMATPIDLEDFAVGFCLSERIVSRLAQIDEIVATETDQGWLLKVRIAAECVGAMMDRIRVRVSESSCGLCGLENLEQIARPLPRIASRINVTGKAIFTALNGLSEFQPINRLTGGTHAAAFCSDNGKIILVREDVGRHCALDKLIGGLASAEIRPENGFFLLSSRCSYELVEKTVLAGCPALVTISTATTLAIDRAAQSGLHLIILARNDSVLELVQPQPAPV
jgi:FdhD protein